MSIYLISNRKVTNNRFSNKGTERARRDFRVATCEIPMGSSSATYAILPDNDPDGYKEVAAAFTKQSNKVNLKGLKGTAYMFADIYNQMLNITDGQSDCLFFIHGFANKLEGNLEHIKKLHDIYIKPKDSGIDHLIYVAWPSIGHKVGTYWNDQNDAEETGRVLGGLFSKLYGFFIDLFEISGMERCSNRIHLAAHSMGNTVLDYMLQNIPTPKLFNLFGETLLLNSDVRFDIFENKGSFTKLEALSSRTHIYISQSDDVLSMISRYTKNFKRRLGHKGPKNLKKLPSETIVIDTTDVGKASSFREKTLDHWGYIERDKVIADIKQVLTGRDEENIKGRKESKKGKNYFVLE